jgi:hypothetical protein
MAHPKGKSWKLELASVHRKAKTRPRSNKYSKSDSDTKPAPHSRGKVWVGGYVRSDGRKVKGHYRAIAQT